MPPHLTATLRAEITAIMGRAGLLPGVSARTTTLAAASSRSASSPDDDGGLRWVLTTEAPATVFDWQRYEFVDEILLMDGLVLPDNRQVPLLDAHSRWSVDDILGSVTDFTTGEAGGHAAIEATVRFAADDRSQRARQKVVDGHLTDGSVGYRVTGSVWVPAGERAAIRGRLFAGPVKVSHEWHLKEFSVTPIGADALAKVRSLRPGHGGR